MRQPLTLAVQGGTTHTIPMAHVNRLQAVISEFGAEIYPLFLRLGAIRRVEMQPVVARSLLAELEKAVPLMKGKRMPGVSFRDSEGNELGGIFGAPDGSDIASAQEAHLSVTPRGIRAVVQQFPPPVGFRSAPTLESGWFECYFESLHFTPDAVTGRRTPAMGGSGAPVSLQGLPSLPPVTRWDYSRVAGQVSVAVAEFVESPAEEVFRDVLHAVMSACNESLRLKRVLRIGRDA